MQTAGKPLRVSVSLTPEQHTQLRRLAKESELSLSEMMAETLEVYLEGERLAKTAPAMKRPSNGSTGCL